MIEDFIILESQLRMDIERVPTTIEAHVQTCVRHLQGKADDEALFESWNQVQRAIDARDHKTVELIEAYKKADVPEYDRIREVAKHTRNLTVTEALKEMRDALDTNEE